jgi:glycosyltransferase involved in cell wall biosynthesis
MDSGKVLIVVENSSVPFDVRVWYEATTLRDAGWQVTVICPSPIDVDADNYLQNKQEVKQELLDGIKVIRFALVFGETGAWNFIKEYLVSFFSIARLCWRVWQKQGFDVIHICNPPDIFFPIGLFYRLLGAKFIFDHHDLFPEMVLARFSGVKAKLLYILARLMEYFTLRSANVIIVNNESFHRFALERGRVSDDLIVTVRNGPKIGEFRPVVPKPELKGNFRYMICFVGVMGQDDGVLELIESIRYINQNLGREDILFYLLGDGSSRTQALEKVTEWGLSNFVDLPGMILDKYLLREYMSTADVCVSPEPATPMNSYSSFIKIGEYMAMGKPIVAYDLEESRYTAQESAIYVTPGDTKAFGQAIIDLIDNPRLRKNMGESALLRVKNLLSWEHQEKQLIQAYTIALEDNNSY